MQLFFSVFYRFILFLTLLIPLHLLGQCWSEVTCGAWHTLGIKTNGSLYAWGANFNGQLGDASNLGKIIPTQVGSSTDWQKIAAGDYHSLALRSNGTLWAWGNNGSGQLGLGNTNSVNAPTQVGNDSTWMAIAAGGDFSLAIKTDGSL